MCLEENCKYANLNLTAEINAAEVSDGVQWLILNHCLSQQVYK